MSVQTLYTAATGMESLQTKLDVIANNLANVNTVGFKKDRANFEDLFYRNDVLPGAETQGQLTPTGIHTGLGTRVSSVQSNFGQGAFQLTNGQLDLAIEGNGFFPINDPATGETLYTRAGNFSLNADGQIVMGSASVGRSLDPTITIPPDAKDIIISSDGNVSVRAGDQQQLSQLGQIQVASFRNPDGLLKLGDNLFAVTDASAAATLGTPGQQGLGSIRQNVLEASNVEPVQELIDLITTQRAFELNSQTVKAGDQILELVANLRRF